MGSLITLQAGILTDISVPVLPTRPSGAVAYRAMYPSISGTRYRLSSTICCKNRPPGEASSGPSSGDTTTRSRLPRLLRPLQHTASHGQGQWTTRSTGRCTISRARSRRYQGRLRCLPSSTSTARKLRVLRESCHFKTWIGISYGSSTPFFRATNRVVGEPQLHACSIG